VLTVGIAELRKVLGDDSRTPKFIETVHRRGYRFLPTVSTTPPVASSQYSVFSREKGEDRSQESEPGVFSLPTQHSALSTQYSVLVGREAELAQLHTWFNKVLEGERQLVFVTGEPGIGKTALVDTFLSGLSRQEVSSLTPTPWIGHGHCIEHFGTGEAYLPVFTALGQLGHASSSTPLLDILLQYAPTWLAQMPALLNAATLEAVQRRAQGATPERMLREITEALEALTVDQPLVLVLEDLHWSGDSTLDLLSFLARRRHPARLLVLGTYRPADVATRDHPLRNLMQDLQRRGQCQEAPLEPLPEAAVETYLTVTFPRHRLPDSLAGVLHRRTAGNPLFLVEVMQDWVRRDLLAEVAGAWQLQSAVEDVVRTVPPSLYQLIERQLEQLSRPDQQLLEAASIAGEEFSAAVVATAVGETLENVEGQCESLVRRAQVLKARGTAVWPDGTVATRYSFTHALYAQALYERMGAGRRVRLHQQIGQRLEEAYGAKAEEIAGELAVHFERGREYERAVRYLEQAARKALRRSAPQEAIHHLHASLRVLESLPNSPEHIAQELTLQTLLAPALMAAKGYGAPEVEQVYARVRTLSRQIEESPQLFPVLAGIAGFHIVRAEYRIAYEVAEQLLGMARHAQDPGLLVEGYAIMGVVLFYLGEFAAARTQLEQSMALYDPQHHRSHAVQYGQDPWVLCRAFLSWTLWILGYPEQALHGGQEAIAYARELNHPMSLAFALHIAAIVHNTRREPQAVDERTAEVIALASEHGLPYWLAQATFTRGQTLIQRGRQEEGVTQMRQVAQAFRRDGKGSGRPAQLALLAEAYQTTKQPEMGLQTLAEALATASNGSERYWEAEVYRLKGELLLAMRASERRNPTPRVE
jgi:predicted ATPase